jgi:signal peptidase
MLYTDEAIKKRKKNEKIVKNIITTLGYIILIPLLIYNLLLIAQAVINPNETPSFLGIKTYVIISGSMKPNLDIGDIVIVKKASEEELNEGDIIAFRQGQNVITHRISEIIVENGEKVYKTKGDSNNTEDSGTIKYELIEGKMINKIDFLGNISLFLQNKIVIIIILIVFYIYLSYSGAIKKRKRERREKRLEYEINKKG